MQTNKGLRGVGVVLLLLVWCVSLNGCDFIFYRKFTSASRAFSILLPRAWSEAKDPKAVILVKAPLDSNGDKFQENVNVMVTDMPAKVPLDTFFEYNKIELARVMPNAYDMKERATYNGFIPGRVLTFDNDVDGLPLRMISGVWIKDSRVYVVTCVGEVSKFKKYQYEFEKIMGSLRML